MQEVRNIFWNTRQLLTVADKKETFSSLLYRVTHHTNLLYFCIYVTHRTHHMHLLYLCLYWKWGCLRVSSKRKSSIISTLNSKIHGVLFSDFYENSLPNNNRHLLFFEKFMRMAIVIFRLIPSFTSRRSLMLSVVYRYICLMNHQKTHQT